jgi:hypothetical protein
MRCLENDGTKYVEKKGLCFGRHNDIMGDTSNVCTIFYDAVSYLYQKKMFTVDLMRKKHCWTQSFW